MEKRLFSSMGTIALSGAIALSTLSGCGSSDSVVSAASGSASVAGNSVVSTSANDDNTIKIGGTFTLTGSNSHAGQATFEGANLAIDYVNDILGGVNGKKVKLVYYDDEFDESKIPSLYEKLINEDKVDLLVSPYTSPMLAAAPIIDKYDKIMFTDAADSYTANEQYGQEIVNIQMDETWQGGMWWKDVFEYLADFDNWNENSSLSKPKTVAIANLETTYGHEITDSVVPFLEKNGFEVVYNEYFDPGTSDWTAAVQKIKALDPDVVFAPQYFEDSVTFVQKCIELNYYADFMIVEGMCWDPTAWCNPKLGGLEPSIAKRNFIGYSMYKENYKSDSKDYVANYIKKEYNSIPGNDVLCGFMAVELACKAADAAGSCEKNDLINALTSNTFDLAGYQYTMNETGGNGADFHWGVGQYQPETLADADTSGDDWEQLYPYDLATAKANVPFQGWD